MSEITDRARAIADAKVQAARQARDTAVATARQAKDDAVASARLDADERSRQAEADATDRVRQANEALAAARAGLGQVSLQAGSFTEQATRHLGQAVDGFKQTKVASALVQEADQHVIMAIPEDTYQAVFDQMTAPPAPYRLVQLNGYRFGDTTYINTLWTRYTQQDAEAHLAWYAYHGLDGAAYQERFDELAGRQGFKLAQINTYLSGTQIRYAPIFTRDDRPTPAWSAYHGVSLAEHQRRFDELVGQGYRLVNQPVVYTDGGASVAALYDSQDTGPWAARGDLTAEQYQQSFDQYTAQGLGLSYLDVKNDLAGVPRFTAIWTQPTCAALVARHNLDGGAYHTEYMNWVSQGYVVRLIVSYQNGTALNYAVLWSGSS